MDIMEIKGRREIASISLVKDQTTSRKVQGRDPRERRLPLIIFTPSSIIIERKNAQG